MKKRISIIFGLGMLLSIFSVPNISTAQDEGEEDRSIDDEVFYNILVDRYNNGRQAPSEQVDTDDPYTYNGGDIQGITDRLEDIDEAGFTSISISPIMENKEKSYHGYLVEDYFSVEEEFGDMDDLHTLIEEAHDKDIRVILEMDLHYVAETSPLVEEHSSWFEEVEEETVPATEWLDEAKAFDDSKQEVQEYIKKIADFWKEEADIDGYNIHGAEQMDTDFLTSLTEKWKKDNPEFYILATSLDEKEDMDDLQDIDAIDAVSNIDMFEAFNDTLTKPDQPISHLYETWESSDNDKSLLYVDTITTPRFSNNFADHGRTAETTWDLALAYLYFTPGVPMIYQGSEIPMYGPGYPENQYLADFTSSNPDLEDQFSKMAAVRDEFAPLRKGDIELLDSDEGFSLFKRSYEGEDVYVGINNDDESRVIDIDGLGEDVQLKGLLQDDTVRQQENGKLSVGLERESQEVYIVEKDQGFNWVFIGFVAGVLLLFVVGVIGLKVKQNKREKNAEK